MRRAVCLAAALRELRPYGPALRASRRVAGDIVGVPRLALEGEEDADPARLRGEVQQQRAVLPDAVVALERAAVALVHVDVVDAAAGAEAEHLVGLRLRPPALPERIQRRARLRDRAGDGAVEQVGEVVVRARRVGRERPHLRRVEEVGADEVQAAPPGCGASAVPSRRQPAERRRHRVPQVRVEQVQQLRRGLLGADVDRDPVVPAVGVDGVDLEVRRVRRPLAAPLDGSRDQHSVSVQWHGRTVRACAGIGDTAPAPRIESRDMSSARRLGAAGVLIFAALVLSPAGASSAPLTTPRLG